MRQPVFWLVSLHLAQLKVPVFLHLLALLRMRLRAVELPVGLLAQARLFQESWRPERS